MTQEQLATVPFTGQLGPPLLQCPLKQSESGVQWVDGYRKEELEVDPYTALVCSPHWSIISNSHIVPLNLMSAEPEHLIACTDRSPFGYEALQNHSTISA